MAKVISFANQKGGVGKSTLCMQTAFYLAIRKKARVLVIDMDGQGNSSSRLAPTQENEFGDKIPLFTGTKAAELFSEEPVKVKPMECPHGIHLIHTPTNDAELFDQEAAAYEIALKPRDNIHPILDNYDYILIDCAPSLGRKLLAALAMSTHVVSPIKLSGFAIDGVEGLVRTIIAVKSHYNPRLQTVGVVVNDMDRSVSHERALEQLERQAGDLLFKNRIMHRPPLDTATTNGVPIWELQYGHVAIKEVTAVIEELLERVERA